MITRGPYQPLVVVLDGTQLPRASRRLVGVGRLKRSGLRSGGPASAAPSAGSG